MSILYVTVGGEHPLWHWFSSCIAHQGTDLFDPDRSNYVQMKVKKLSSVTELMETVGETFKVNVVPSQKVWLCWNPNFIHMDGDDDDDDSSNPFFLVSRESNSDLAATATKQSDISPDILRPWPRNGENVTGIDLFSNLSFF